MDFFDLRVLDDEHFLSSAILTNTESCFAHNRRLRQKDRTPKNLDGQQKSRETKMFMSPNSLAKDFSRQRNFESGEYFMRILVELSVQQINMAVFLTFSNIITT